MEAELNNNRVYRNKHDDLKLLFSRALVRAAEVGYPNDWSWETRIGKSGFIP
jgi:hypothetical protein